MKENNDVVKRVTPNLGGQSLGGASFASPGNATPENTIDIPKVDVEISNEFTVPDGGIPFYSRGYNVLHDYNSYNYIFTLSSLTNDQIKNPEGYKSLNLAVENPEYYIILRSGGYQRDTSGKGSEKFQKNMNMDGVDFESADEVFANAVNEGGSSTFKGSVEFEGKGRDLFIDDIKFKTAVGLSTTNGAGNLTTGTFTVIEPHSVAGFYEELYNAARFAGHQDYLGAPFLLSLQFVGHRFAGNIMVTETIEKATRHWPVLINSGQMRVTESGATYNITFTGINASAMNSIVTTLSANIDSPDQINPTAGSVLYHLFDKMNIIEQTAMKEQKKKVGSEKKVNEVVAKNKKSEQFKRGTAGGKVEVAPFLPHKYSLWFPESHEITDRGFLNASSTSTAGANLDFRVHTGDAWQAQADAILSESPDSNFQFLFRPGGLASITNKFAQSKMQSESATFSGFYAVPRLDTLVDEKNKAISDQLKIYNEKAEKLADENDKLKEKRKEIIKEIQIYYSPNDEQLENFFKLPDNKEFILDEDSGIEYAPTINFKAWNNIDPDSVNPKAEEVGNTDPPPDLSKAEEKLKTLRSEYYAQLKVIETLKKELDVLNKQGQKLQENRDGVFETTYVKYGVNKETWQFKKGTTLDQNITQIIIDSDYAKSLDDNIAEFESTGFIKWFRIEKYALPYGYDTYYNREVYDIHYCIQPFDVHISQIPGPTEGYAYDQAKENAIREYNYIYTGKNLDVMNFNLDFNALYFAPAQYRKKNDPEASTAETTEKKINLKPSEIITAPYLNRVGNKRTQPAQVKDTTTSSVSAPNSSNQTAKFLHETLYNNPGEKALLKAEIGIIGDPVYLVGSGIGNRPRLRSDKKETDMGEMNSFTREVDIIFSFGTAIDTPTNEELMDGISSMYMEPSYYSGLYKLLTIDSVFNQGVFSQTITCARRINQKEDYTETRPVAFPKLEPEEDKTQGPAPDEEIQKLDKAPQVKIETAEELARLREVNPEGIDGLSEVSSVQISSQALGLGKTAFGGNVITSLSEAKTIAGQVGSGTFNPAQFTPAAVQSVIETNASGTTIIETASNVAGGGSVTAVSGIVKSSAGNVVDSQGNPVRSA